MIDVLEGFFRISEASEIKKCSDNNIRRHVLKGKLNGLEIAGNIFVKDDEIFQNFKIGEEKPKKRKKYFAPPVEAPKQKCNLIPA
jgi:hypothetical protein